MPCSRVWGWGKDCGRATPLRHGAVLLSLLLLLGGGGGQLSLNTPNHLISVCLANCGGMARYMWGSPSYPHHIPSEFFLTVLSASNEMTNTTENVATVAIMKRCDLHGKTRQTGYLFCSNEDDDIWQCREDERCKMSMAVPPSEASKSQQQVAAAGDPADPKEGDESLFVSVLEKQAIEDFSQDSLTTVTSWADEVDEEYPVEEEYNRIEPTSSGYTIDQGSYDHSYSGAPAYCPSVPQNFYGQARKHRIGKNVTHAHPQFKNNGPRQGHLEPEIFDRVEQLEEEILDTKRGLRRANEQVKQVMKNENRLGLQLREMRLELDRLRERTFQLDLTGNGDRHRRSHTAKLNPGATPFVPSPRALDSGRNMDSARNDSARSNPSDMTSARSMSTTVSSSEVEVTGDSDSEGDLDNTPRAFDSPITTPRTFTKPFVVAPPIIITPPTVAC